MGNEKDSGTWPAISISHPRGREDYRPPEGTGLLRQWLTDHNLLGGEPLPDIQIGRSTAILHSARAAKIAAHNLMPMTVISLPGLAS
jgi:hypothetical protein